MPRPKQLANYTKLTLGVEEDVLKKAKALKKATGKSLSAMFAELVMDAARSRSIKVDLSAEESVELKTFCKAHGVKDIQSLMKLAVRAYVNKPAKSRS